MTLGSVATTSCNNLAMSLAEISAPDHLPMVRFVNVLRLKSQRPLWLQLWFKALRSNFRPECRCSAKHLARHEDADRSFFGEGRSYFQKCVNLNFFFTIVYKYWDVPSPRTDMVFNTVFKEMFPIAASWRCRRLLQTAGSEWGNTRWLGITVETNGKCWAAVHCFHLWKVVCSW